MYERDTASFSPLSFGWARGEWKAVLKLMERLKIKEAQKYSELTLFTSRVPGFYQLVSVPSKRDISKCKSELVIITFIYIYIFPLIC